MIKLFVLKRRQEISFNKYLAILGYWPVQVPISVSVKTLTPTILTCPTWSCQLSSKELSHHYLWSTCITTQVDFLSQNLLFPMLKRLSLTWLKEAATWLYCLHVRIKLKMPHIWTSLFWFHGTNASIVRLTKILTLKSVMKPLVPMRTYAQ
jgi:hypothetical protein